MVINSKRLINYKVLWLTFMLLLSGCRLLDEDRILEPDQTLAGDNGSIPVKPISEQQLSPTGNLATITSITTSVVDSTYTPTFPTINTPLITLTYSLTASPTIVPFQVQPDSPAYIQNFAHPHEGCDWSGVAGQVFNKTGNALQRVVILVEGRYGNKSIDSVTLTGLKTAEKYGPGGYEIYLGNKPISTDGTLSIQLFDLDANPISDAISFSTYDVCSKNLVVINFSIK